MSKATQSNTTPGAPPLVSHATPARRGILAALAGAAALAPLAVATAAQAAPGADAELIALCNRFVAIEAEIAAIFAECESTDRNEKRIEPLIDALYAERERIEERLNTVPDASSMAGFRAQAAAALCEAPRNADGSLMYGNGMAEMLAFDLCRVLVESVA